MQSTSAMIVVVLVFGCVLAIQAGQPCRQPPILVRPDHCCELPKVDKDKEVAEKCMTKYAGQTARLMADKSGGPPRGCCVAQCFFNGTGHADLNADQMSEETIKQVEALGLAAEWSPVIKGAAEVCKAEAQKHAEDFEAGFKLPPLDPTDEVCHPKYGFALLCSLKEMISNCPAKFFKDTPECKQLQEFSKTCEL